MLSGYKTCALSSGQGADLDQHLVCDGCVCDFAVTRVKLVNISFTICNLQCFSQPFDLVYVVRTRYVHDKWFVSLNFFYTS